ARFTVITALCPFWLLVIPNFVRGPRSIEKQNISWDSRVRCEHAVGQSHNGMKIEFVEELFFNSCSDSASEQSTVRSNNRCASRVRHAPDFAHDQLKKQQRSLCSLFVVRKIRQ